MRLVLVGETNEGSRTLQRLEALRRLGHEVEMVSTTPPGWTYETRPSLADRLRYRLRLPADPTGASAEMLRAASRGCDAVILDAAKMIRPQALRAVARVAPAARLVWYSEDDMMNPIHRSRYLSAALDAFDLWVTTKSYNADPAELPQLGVKRVMVVDNSFDRRLHAPISLAPGDFARFAADIAFVGTFEEPRAEAVLALAVAGLSVRVWGNGWNGWAGRHPLLRVEGRPVYGDDYRRVVAAAKINLCFLRKGNRDLQTCRSIEIPAMGGFMAHERSAEMERLLAPGRDAEFFHGPADLIALCRRHLADDGERQRMAASGRQRILADGHTHEDRWAAILAAAMEGT